MADETAADKPDDGLAPLRVRAHEVIFEADTRGGKVFDVVLIVAILLSIVVVMLDSYEIHHDRVPESILNDPVFHRWLYIAEWVFTGLFTIEYIVRLLTVKKPLRYACSFFGVVDLLAILPTFVSLVVPGSSELLVIRALRLLRIFRVFKLARYLTEANSLMAAIRVSLAKVAVFLVTVLTIVVIMGAAMHLIEGPEHGFDSIPQSIYWAIVTMTTVGYGDITPQTPLGKLLASVMMVLAYSLIIVPTGVVTAELVYSREHGEAPVSTQACPSCGKDGHAYDASHCKHCGARLHEDKGAADYATRA